VYSAAKPLLEKTLTILVEGLIDTFLSLFHESKSKGLKSLDTNGFCQLMLEVLSLPPIALVLEYIPF
jgi:exocyst complex component 2